MLRSRMRTALTVIDKELTLAKAAVKKRGKKISCRKGCSSCCNLLVEVVWEEALELATWLNDAPPHLQEPILSKLTAAVRERRRLFGKRKNTVRFKQPVLGDFSMPEYLFSDYFYSATRTCPFLIDGSCSAYKARPSACRLHLVTSPADNCSASSDQSSKIVVPREITQVRKRVETVVLEAQDDGRWGELSIMVSLARQAIKRRRQSPLP